MDCRGATPVERLRRRPDFVAAAGGVRVGAGPFLLQARERPDVAGPARFGFTVTKRIGGAVERNRIRRRLRAAVRALAPLQARPGHDYVLVARRSALDVPFDALVAELGGALRRAGSRGATRGRPPSVPRPQADTRDDDAAPAKE